MPGLVTGISRWTARGRTTVGTAPPATRLTRGRQSNHNYLWLHQNSDIGLESAGEARGGTTGGSTPCPSPPQEGGHNGTLRHHHHLQQSAMSKSLHLLDTGHQHHQGSHEINQDGPAVKAGQGEWRRGSPPTSSSYPSSSPSTASHRRPIHTQEVRSHHHNHLQKYNMEDSKDAYLPKPGPGAWLEPPTLPPSSSSSTDSVQTTSSSLPGSNFRGKGVSRSAGAPVVLCDNNTLSTNILLQDCRVPALNFGESKTTVTVDWTTADRANGGSGTILGCRLGLDETIITNPQGCTSYPEDIPSFHST